MQTMSTIDQTGAVEAEDVLVNQLRAIKSFPNRARKELSAWEVERNTVAAKVNWQFRTEDARIKLNSLYPTFTTASE